MPSINPTLVGHGKALISGGAALTIIEVAPKVTIRGPLVSIEGNQPSVERLHHAGWIAVGFDSGASPPDLVTWSTWIHYPYEDFELAPRVFGDSYFWDLDPGTTIELEIDW